MGEYQSGEKEPAVLEDYFYPAQISWGAAPLSLMLFLSQELESECCLPWMDGGIH